MYTVITNFLSKVESEQKEENTSSLKKIIQHTKASNLIKKDKG